MPLTSRPGGSTAGIQACINHTVDIGMCSRELKADEKVLDGNSHLL